MNQPRVPAPSNTFDIKTQSNKISILPEVFLKSGDGHGGLVVVGPIFRVGTLPGDTLTFGERCRDAQRSAAARRVTRSMQRGEQLPILGPRTRRL